MLLADFSLYFACPACGARPRKECTEKGDSPASACHAERLAIAKEYQRSIRRWDGLVTSDLIS
jgi:hypothetical protein